MNRLAGIVVAVIGFIVAISSVLKVIPSLTSTGVALILLGGLVIGLSFVDKPDAGGTERMPTPLTLANIFVSPGEVFQNLRRHPRWLVAVLMMSVLSAVYFNAFQYRLGPDRVAGFALDKTKEMSFMTEEARTQIEASRPQTLEDNRNPVLRAGQAVNGFVGMTFWLAFLGGVFFLFAMAMGGVLNYWQAFAAAVYSTFAFSVIRFVLNMIVLFIKDPTDVHPITGQSSLIQDNLSFLVSAADNPVVYTLLASFSLLGFYWIWMNVTGLTNAGEKVSSSTAWTATLSVFFGLVFLGLIAALLFPSFIS